MSDEVSTFINFLIPKKTNTKFIVVQEAFQAGSFMDIITAKETPPLRYPIFIMGYGRTPKISISTKVEKFPIRIAKTT